MIFQDYPAKIVVGKCLISISEKTHGTVKYYCGLLSTFILEGDDKFQLEVSEYKHAISFPFKFTDP